MQVRYPRAEGGSTATAFALAAGRVALPAEFPGDGASNTPSIPTGPGVRGCEIVFFVFGADNATCDYRLWRVNKGRTADSEVPQDAGLQYLGGGTATASAAMGPVLGGPISSSERVCDTITFTPSSDATTPKGEMASIIAAYGGTAPVAYSPANDTPARLRVPDIGPGDGLIVEMKSASAYAGALVLLT